MADDKYDKLEKAYVDLIRRLAPLLSSERIGMAINAVNDLVRLERPANWAMSNEPRELLGVTSDKLAVVYSTQGRLNSYEAKFVADMREYFTNLLQVRDMSRFRQKLLGELEDLLR